MHQRYTLDRGEDSDETGERPPDTQPTNPTLTPEQIAAMSPFDRFMYVTGGPR